MADAEVAALRKARRERKGSQMPATRVMPAVEQMTRAQADWAALQERGAKELAAWRQRRTQ